MRPTYPLGLWPHRVTDFSEGNLEQNLRIVDEVEAVA
jgi:hypothetical protein